MLDISIKALDKVITSPKKAADFIRKHIKIVEKIDGTKLTLIRNNEPFDPKDYTKNWIVGYKGSVIYPTEFRGLEGREDEIRTQSLGTSQYKFVHDHLRRVHPGTGSVPPGTEFFVEFVQNKPTITRDYARKHGMFLVGFGPADFVITRGQLYSTSSMVEDPEALDEYREILQLGAFPVIFEGNLSSRSAIISGALDENLRNAFAAALSGADFSDPLDIVRVAREVLGELESSLGGKAEGVVIQVYDDDMSLEQLYKVLAADQHSKTARAEKKSRFTMSEEDETAYWDEVNHTVDDLLDRVGTSGDPQDVLDELSELVYGMSRAPVRHALKSKINVQEDILLTAKLRLLGGAHKATRVAVIPMAAKPFHAGHDSLLARAVEDGNDAVIVFLATGGREEITTADMVPLWRDVYQPGVERAYGGKVTLRFSDSPMREAMLVAADLVRRNNATVRLYGDPADAEERVSGIVAKNPELRGKVIARPVDRAETGGVSGTAMRGYLASGDKKSFVSNLPTWMSPEEASAVWSRLYNKFGGGLKGENLLRSVIGLLIKA